MVKLGGEPVSPLNDLDRIQDQFPTDNLLLYDKDPLSPRSKYLVRKRSTTASRLQRALSGKNKVVPTEKQNNNGGGSDVICSEPETSPSPRMQTSRNYIMDEAVQLTAGVQSQDRHFFLFNDVLIIAKARASASYKLKEKVRVAELWLGNCLEVVCEVAKNAETSFVVGWPTTNVVATFSSTHTRDLWLAKLKQLISDEQQKGPQTTSIRVHYWDAKIKEEYAHNVSVTQKETVIDCIGTALQQLDSSCKDVSNYQLWVKTDRESAPYPLIGHESPFAIKMSCLYAALAVNGEDAFDTDYSKSISSSNCPVLKCYFILRSTRRGSFDLVTPKKSKRARKSPILQKVFRRSLSKPESLDTAGTACESELLYGKHLSRIVVDGVIPKPIMDIFQALNDKGPYTVGIFRKSANARACRELREKLNSSEESCDVSSVNIFVLAAVIKEFLRNLPDCLLLCGLYLEWLAVSKFQSTSEKIQAVQRLLSKLPECHVLFLKHFICILWQVHHRSSENMMTATNLAVCVGPSLLWSSDCNTPTYTEQTEASKQVPAVVEFLISHCETIFGEECLSLFGSSPRRDLSRQDSGNEESDSLHSLQSSQSSVGLRRDDSSIDSLERAFLGEGEASPKLPCKSKMSLTNLSRDSGLTMSDTQLYTPDEEMDSEASSGVEARQLFHHHHQGPQSLMTTPTSRGRTGDAVVASQYRADNWHSSRAKARSVSSGSGGDSACSVDGNSNHSSPNEKRLGVGIPSCITPAASYYAVRQHKSLDADSRSSTSGQSSNISRVPPRHQSTPTRHGNHSGSTSLLQRGSTLQNHGSSSRPIFPLGSGKEVIKRRLSRSRAWVRPSSSYGIEQITDDEPVMIAMRKSASEESILSNYVSTSAASAYLTYKRPAHHNKGKAPVPPPSVNGSQAALPIDRHHPSRSNGQGGTSSPSRHGRGMIRSKSMHQFNQSYEDEEDFQQTSERCNGSALRSPGSPWTAGNQWQGNGSAAVLRSGGGDTSHDFSYDSSTLSDNDSTPHISRSNSRGKDYGVAGSTGSSTTNNYVYADVYSDWLGSGSATYEEVAVRSSGGTLKKMAVVPAGGSRARQMYDESVRIYKEQMHSEIHHAAPVRIENSDEELEAPPLPPKPQLFKLQSMMAGGRSTSESRSPAADADWHAFGTPPSTKSAQEAGNAQNNCGGQYHVLPIDGGNGTVINVSGKRVLAATQSMYDVPPWCGPKSGTARPSRSPCARTIMAAQSSSRASRSKTMTAAKLASQHHRAKSQPPPEEHCRPSAATTESIYDCPRKPVRCADRCATLSSAPTSLQLHNHQHHHSNHHPIQEPWRTGGATIGRTFRKEISWSVSQLKALFSRNKENPMEIMYDCAGNACHRTSKSGETNSKCPPPYRPPPKVADTASDDGGHSWTATLKRNRPSQCGAKNSSFVESPESTSGGEESYV